MKPETDMFAGEKWLETRIKCLAIGKTPIYRCFSVVGRFASACHVPSKSVRNRSTSLVYHHDCEATVEVEVEEFRPEYHSEFGIIPLKAIGMLISLT